MDYADLHIHSTHSDGKMSVSEIIHHANNMNLKAISITDHDTITGTKEALSFIGNVNIEIIPGIEFSTVHNGEDIHILGYMFDPAHKEFNAFIENMQVHRSERAEKMVDKFHSLGIDITMNNLLEVSRGESIGRPHFAQLLIQKGYAKNIYDAFQKYLLPGSLCYVERYKLAPDYTIDMIKEAGGLAVLAHPGLIKNQESILDIIAMKIDGLEVYHSSHSSQQIREYYFNAKENNLLVTGGSDCHGKVPNEKPFIGSVKIPYTYVEKLKKARVY